VRVKQVLFEVVDKFFRGGGLEGMLVEPAAQEGIEHLAAGALLQGAQEPRALRINQAAIGVGLGIGVGAARGQHLLGRRDGGQRSERLVLLHLQIHLRHFLAVQLLDDARGDVSGKAFVQPHMLPRGVGHQVAGPRVRQFMRDQVDQAFVAGDHGRRQEGQARIFHAAERERWRQHDHVVALPRYGPYRPSAAEIIFSVSASSLAAASMRAGSA
jgi:hypothetical protein